MGYNPLGYKQLDTIEPHTHATWKEGDAALSFPKL